MASENRLPVRPALQAPPAWVGKFASPSGTRERSYAPAGVLSGAKADATAAGEGKTWMREEFFL